MKQRCLCTIMLFMGMCFSSSTLFAGGHQEPGSGTSDFSLNSPAVEKGRLLEQFRCEGKKKGIEPSIPLEWENIPAETKSLAVVMYHYPHPEDTTIVNSYLLLWGINPSVMEIPHGEAGSGNWYMGRNKDGNAVSYTSPCSPSPGDHEYVIALFALAEYPKDLPEKNTIDVDYYTFMAAMEKAGIIEKAELVFKDSGPQHENRSSSEKQNNQPPPPPGRPGHVTRSGGPGNSAGEPRYSVSQAISDKAQLHTIAFNALAFFTGNASADTFLPPGKVSDFFSFQYFRDVDSGGMGHNTTQHSSPVWRTMSSPL